MKTTKTTTFWHVRRNVIKAPSERDVFIFEQLKSLLQPYESRLEVRINTVYQYELWTKDWVRMATYFHRPKNKKFQFAALAIYEKHISLHFHPLFMDRSIKDKLKMELLILSAGVAVFHFKDVDDKIKVEVQELLKIGWECYQRLKFVRQ